MRDYWTKKPLKVTIGEENSSVCYPFADKARDIEKRDVGGGVEWLDSLMTFAAQEGGDVGFGKQVLS